MPPPSDSVDETTDARARSYSAWSVTDCGASQRESASEPPQKRSAGGFRLMRTHTRNGSMSPSGAPEGVLPDGAVCTSRPPPRASHSSLYTRPPPLHPCLLLYPRPLPLPPAADSDVHGWLSKRGGAYPHTWGARYFTFSAHDRKLSYYQLAKRNATPPFVLRGSATLRAAQLSSPTPLFQLEVEGQPGDVRTWVVRPSSVEERDWWVRELSALVKDESAAAPSPALAAVVESDLAVEAVASEAAAAGGTAAEASAATTVQAALRGRMAREQLHGQAAAAATFRAKQARTNIRTLCAAAALLQAAERGRKARERLRLKRSPLLCGWMTKRGPKFPYPWQERYVEFYATGCRLVYYAKKSKPSQVVAKTVSGEELILRGEGELSGARAGEPRPLLVFERRAGGAEGAEAVDELILRPKDTKMQELWLSNVHAALRGERPPLLVRRSFSELGTNLAALAATMPFGSGGEEPAAPADAHAQLSREFVQGVVEAALLAVHAEAPKVLSAWMQKRGAKFPHNWQDRLIEFNGESGTLKYSAKENGSLVLKGDVRVLSVKAIEPRPLMSFEVEAAQDYTAESPPRSQSPVDASRSRMEIVVRPKDMAMHEAWLRIVSAAIEERNAALALLPIPPDKTRSEGLDETGRHLEGIRSALMSGHPKSAQLPVSEHPALTPRLSLPLNVPMESDASAASLLSKYASAVTDDEAACCCERVGYAGLTATVLCAGARPLPRVK
ncbi:hypothetical protein AB1Y20_007276 [Prymnesium parvum]|uniref:PH domain-containing protein n=1 Tax=Prymnesium parvum TaxID=97485 RepID=A0AB34IVN0_PRYPA